MHKILLTFSACATLALSLPAYAENPKPTPSSVVTDSPSMTFGSWGVDLSDIDRSIKPGDDFFGYFNSKWIAKNPVPPEYTRYGPFTMLGEKARADVRTLVDELVAAKPAPGTSERRIVDSYQSYLDVDTIDKAGLAPARPYLDRIYSAASLAELSALFGQPGLPSPFGAWVMIDDEQPDRYVVGVGVGGLGLPDRDYYFRSDAKSREIQSKYRDYLTFLLEQAGYADPRNAAKAVYDLEHKFAVLGWDRALSRNRDLTYNKVSSDQLLALSGKFPLQPMLAEAGLGKVSEFVVAELPPDPEEVKRLGIPSDDLAKLGGGLPAMFSVLAEAPLATVQAWTTAHYLSTFADVLPSAFDEARFAFYGKLLNGQEQQRPRWKRAIATVEGQLGEVLGKTYVERHFPPENKAAMDELVGNLRKAMSEALAGNDWMSAATKAEAARKLEQFSSKIGYPDEFETYEGLVVQPGKPLENAIAASAWAWKDELAKLGGPIDRAEWHMLPQTVNAYYNPSLNEIVFPAAILQPPFFNLSADPAVNYGAIGAVIGHEIGHGFDDQGAKYDGTGLARDWWAPQDLAAFTERGSKLVEQFNGFCPLDSGKFCVNGRLTLGENIGDLAGVSIAHRAYRMSLGGKEAPVIDGLTGDQRFFLAYAQVWRTAIREEALRSQISTDPHSPAEFRVNGTLRNVDAWYRAFNVKRGDRLYLPPEQRVRIW